MKNLTDDQLRNILEEASCEWTRRFKEEPRMLSVQFPKGHIRRLREVCDRWHYLNYDQRRAIGCALQLSDINQWFNNLWKINLTAGSEWDWQSSLPVVAVIEMLVYCYGIKADICDENTAFKKGINKFHNAGVIGNELRDELHEVREMRNGIHLYLKGGVENHDNKPRRYNRASRVLNKLEVAINEHQQT